MTEEEYIRSAVLEKMRKQDAEYTESVPRKKYNLLHKIGNICDNHHGICTCMCRVSAI